MAGWILGLGLASLQGFAVFLSPLACISKSALVDLAFLDDGRCVLVASGQGVEIGDVSKFRRVGIRPRANNERNAVDPGRTVVAVATDGGGKTSPPQTPSPIRMLPHPRLVMPFIRRN